MIKIDMEMPRECTRCPFFRGSISGGSCAADIWDELSFAYACPDLERHARCQLQEVEE